MRKGYTLLEVIVASSLLLLVLALAFGYLVPATKAAARYRTRSHLQQTATVALKRIEEVAATTSPGGFSWSDADPVAVAFNPVENLQPGNAVLLWTTTFRTFWWDSEQELLREAEWPPGPPEPSEAESSVLRAKRLLRPRLMEVVEQAPKVRVLAEGVVGFSVTHKGDAEALIQPVTLTLRVADIGRKDRADRLSLSRSLTFRLVNQQ